MKKNKDSMEKTSHSMEKTNIKPCWVIYGNVYQTKKSKYVARILETLRTLQVNVLIEKQFANFLAHNLHIDIADYSLFCPEEKNATPDAAISIGGDGTFLTTASQLGLTGVPILGINTGRLGFLADVSPHEIEPSLQALAEGRYVVEDRCAIHVFVNGEPFHTRPLALNEVAVLKHDNSSLIEIVTTVDDALLTTYSADGLIVSTPTGSTGYSLSVGGPVLMPTTPTFCLAPVAPHSLHVRPVVVRDDVMIRMRVKSRSGNFLLAADGVSKSLPQTAEVCVKKAPRPIRVIKIQHTDFFDTLREKLMWGADGRHQNEI